MEKSASHHDQKEKKSSAAEKLRIWRRKVIISEGFELKISIFGKFKNLMFLKSETIFRYQILIPDLSEMARELKNIIFNDLWKINFFTPCWPIGGAKMGSGSGLKLITRSSYQDGSEI